MKRKSSVNRNKVESEVIPRISEDPGFFRVNRNKVESEVKQLKKMMKDAEVLIETKWNLKTAMLGDQQRMHIVLIETKWNLKENSYKAMTEATGC